LVVLGSYPDFLRGLVFALEIAGAGRIFTDLNGG
jgi:hypothetical protein